MMSFVQSLDMSVLQSLYAMRDSRVVQLLIGVSEFGSALTIYGLGACAVLGLLLYRKYAPAAGLSLALVMSGVGVILAKGLIERPRPPVSFRSYTEIWYSFPSAHATLSTALYGYFMFLIWSFVPSLPMRILGTILLSALIVSISFSRMYLGVHYMSDVVAGILLGAFSAWLGYRWVFFARNS